MVRNERAFPATTVQKPSIFIGRFWYCKQLETWQRNRCKQNTWVDGNRQNLIGITLKPLRTTNSEFELFSSMILLKTWPRIKTSQPTARFHLTTYWQACEIIASPQVFAINSRPISEGFHQVFILQCVERNLINLLTLKPSVNLKVSI
jgi:hypothetical protein